MALFKVKTLKPHSGSLALFVFVSISFCLSFIFSSQLSCAFTRSVNSSGSAKSWSSSSLSFYGNYSNNNGLSYSDVFTSITNSLNRWKHSGAVSVDFSYWQSSTNVNPVVSYDGRNTIFFYSHAKDSTSLGSGVLGVTYVYSLGTQIVEADIVLNDVDFTFTRTSTDSTSNSVFSSTVFLENVLTHELGHAYGLAHSGHLQSTMIWQEAKGQAYLSCDDHNGMAALYPNTSYTSQLGSISGTIKSSDSSSNVFGAHVQAISKRRGTVLAATVSNASGQFTLENLEPGDYIIEVEPFTNIISALCGGSSSGCYYGSSNASTTCSGSPFKKFFVETTTGYPDFYTVSSGGTTNAGSIPVHCSAMSQPIAGATAFGTAPTVISSSPSSIAVYGVLSSNGSSHYYQLSGITGAIKAYALSHTLYSPIDVDVDIRTSSSSATSVATTLLPNVFPNPAPGGSPLPYINYDSEADYTAGSSGTYYISVTRNSALASSKYPASGGIDSVPFYLLIMTLNDSTSLVQVSGSTVLTANGKCQATDSFSAYSDQGEPSATGDSSGTSTIKTPGCGSIVDVSRSSSGKQRSSDRGTKTMSLLVSEAFLQWLSIWWALACVLLWRLRRRT